MADEHDIELIRNLRKKLAERDTKHADIIRKATTEIMALKRQIAVQNGQNHSGQIMSVVVRLQGKIQNLQDDVKDLTRTLNSIPKKEDPINTEEKTPHVEVDKDGDTTYVGKAEPDSSFDKPLWCIQRVTKSGKKTTVEVAENAVWSNRKKETYA